MAFLFLVLIIVLLILYAVIIGPGALTSPMRRRKRWWPASVSFSPQVLERIYSTNTGSIIGRDAVIGINDR